MYQYILFDLDGTLTDPGVGITNSVAYALNKLGIKVADKKSLYKFIGPPLIESFSEFYGFNKEKSQLAVEYYREYFSITGIFENEIYPEIENLLCELKKSERKIIIATSKPEVFAKRIIEHFGLAKYFDFIAGSTLDEARNTKSAVIKYALEKCGITDFSATIMVGDRKHDIYGAKKNNIKAVGVLYGYGNYEELSDAKADYIVESVNDLRNFLLEKEI